jgi:uncharacterized damage-inducible protein DinB
MTAKPHHRFYEEGQGEEAGDQGARMDNDYLVKLYEHNNWANSLILEACLALSDEQLDAEPRSITKGSIRLTLKHLATAQRNYLSLLTLPAEERVRTPLEFSELQQALSASGEGLLGLAKGDPSMSLQPQLETTDGHHVAPWVVMLQVINHASEHREQISSMLSALGVTPPDLDGWSYGVATGALVPKSG